jgi:hypothetical protein
MPAQRKDRNPAKTIPGPPLGADADDDHPSQPSGWVGNRAKAEPSPPLGAANDDHPSPAEDQLRPIESNSDETIPGPPLGADADDDDPQPNGWVGNRAKAESSPPLGAEANDDHPAQRRGTDYAPSSPTATKPRPPLGWNANDEAPAQRRVRRLQSNGTAHLSKDTRRRTQRRHVE